MNDNNQSEKPRGQVGSAGWFAIAVMVGFLGWSAWYAVHAWDALDGIDISTAGWIFIVAGVLVTIGLGAGLMALVFYSSRHDMDR
jgi:hypothetical protein